jgi:hypothetical protein
MSELSQSNSDGNDSLELVDDSFEIAGHDDTMATIQEEATEYDEPTETEKSSYCSNGKDSHENNATASEGDRSVRNDDNDKSLVMNFDLSDSKGVDFFYVERFVNGRFSTKINVEDKSSCVVWRNERPGHKRVRKRPAKCSK